MLDAKVNRGLAHLTEHASFAVHPIAFLRTCCFCCCMAVRLWTSCHLPLVMLCSTAVHRQTVCAVQPPKPPMPVAYDPTLKLQDGKPVTKDLYSTTLAMLEQINTVIAKLPALST